MKYVYEKQLFRFNFWGGAKQLARELDLYEFDRIEEQLEELYPNGLTETEINDLFWFEGDFIAQLAGYANYEAMCEAKKDDYDE